MENRVDKSRIVFLLQPSGGMRIPGIEFVIIDSTPTFDFVARMRRGCY